MLFSDSFSKSYLGGYNGSSISISHYKNEIDQLTSCKKVNIEKFEYSRKLTAIVLGLISSLSVIFALYIFIGSGNSLNMLKFLGGFALLVTSGVSLYLIKRKFEHTKAKIRTEEVKFRNALHQRVSVSQVVQDLTSDPLLEDKSVKIFVQNLPNHQLQSLARHVRGIFDQDHLTPREKIIWDLVKEIKIERPHRMEQLPRIERVDLVVLESLGEQQREENLQRMDEATFYEHYKVLEETPKTEFETIRPLLRKIGKEESIED